MPKQLEPYEQTATIMELLKTVPESVHEHFCTKKPSCARHCGCTPTSKIDEKDISKCSLFSASAEENLQHIKNRYNRALLLGRITQEELK